MFGLSFKTESPRSLKGLLGLAVALLGLLAYANSFPGDFFIDDIYIVAENPLVESPDLLAIFTTDYWGPEAKQALAFRPLNILSLAANRHLLGSAAWAYHLVNVLIHALVGVVFFHLLIRWGASTWRAFFAAALFAVHPIHAEVLNMVIGRSELLVALFFLMALSFAADREIRSLVAAGGCFLMALLAKEHAITFLAALLLSDLFFQRDVRSRLPFYGAMLLITGAWLLYRHFGVLNSLRDPANAIHQPLAMLSAPIRILTALKIQLLYLSRLLLPINLQTVYSGPAISEPVATLFSGLGAMISTVIMLITAMSVYCWRLGRLFALAIPLYASCFAVTANVLFVSSVVMAKRLAYLPSIWFCLALVTLLPDPDWSNGGIHRAVVILLALLLVGFGSTTWIRNYDFDDHVRLWSKDFERDHGNIDAGTYLIDAYVQKQQYGKAVTTGEQILARNPNSPEQLEIQAWLLTQDGRPDEALGYAEQALRQMGDSPTEGLIKTLVRINFLIARPSEALKWLDRIEPSKRVGQYWELRGRAYTELGNLEMAKDSYRRSAEPSPGS